VNLRPLKQKQKPIKHLRFYTPKPRLSTLHTFLIPINLHSSRAPALQPLPPLPPLIPLPIRQHAPNPWTVRQPIHLLKVLLANLKRLRRHIGDVFPNQLARIDGGAIDLLQEEAAEGFDAGAEEGGVERDVDAFEGDGGEAAGQFDGGGFGEGLPGAFADDGDELGFYVFEGEGGGEGLDVDFLGFEEVGDVG